MKSKICFYAGIVLAAYGFIASLIYPAVMHITSNGYSALTTLDIIMTAINLSSLISGLFAAIYFYDLMISEREERQANVLLCPRCRAKLPPDCKICPKCNRKIQ